MTQDIEREAQLSFALAKVETAEIFDPQEALAVIRDAVRTLKYIDPARMDCAGFAASFSRVAARLCLADKDPAASFVARLDELGAQAEDILDDETVTTGDLACEVLGRLVDASYDYATKKARPLSRLNGAMLRFAPDVPRMLKAIRALQINAESLLQQIERGQKIDIRLFIAARDFRRAVAAAEGIKIRIENNPEAQKTFGAELDRFLLQEAPPLFERLFGKIYDKSRPGAALVYLQNLQDDSERPIGPVHEAAGKHLERLRRTALLEGIIAENVGRREPGWQTNFFSGFRQALDAPAA